MSSSLRFGRTPEPVTPYQKAAQLWDERIGSARVQAANWRIAALVSLTVNALLTVGLIALALQSRITPWVVEVDKTGAVRAAGPAQADFKPNDALIEAQLARFIRNVRAISADPVVLRERWLTAYDQVTGQAGRFLNAYAERNDPFADIGRRTVTVEIASILRASPDSFQIKWIERLFISGNFSNTRRYTAILTTVINSPDTEEALRRNPLGVFVHDIAWSSDRDQNDAQ